MPMKRLVLAATLLAFAGSPLLAQTPPAPAKPGSSTSSPPASTAPVKPNTPVATPVPPATTAKVNLNTASAADLDNLPQIGPARAKAIVDARSKTKFKDWNDFVARKVVPSNAQKAIMNLVTF